jgi:hypothetical protein
MASAHAGRLVQQTWPGAPHATHSEFVPFAMQALPELHVVPQHGCPVDPQAEHTPAMHQSSVSTHCSPGQHGSPVVPQALDAASEPGSPESSADAAASDASCVTVAS